MRKRARLKTFYAATTTKTLSQHSKQCKKSLLFVTRRELTCWSSGVRFRIWRKFVSTNLPVPKFFHLLKPIDFLQKIREYMVRGLSIVFTRETLVNETFIWNSGNICISIAGIDANQVFSWSMCQPIPTGLYTRCEYDTESNRFKPQRNKSRNFANMVMSYFQRQKPECKTESFYTTGTQKKTDSFKAVGFCAHCNNVFEAIRCFYHYCACQEARTSLTEKDIERGNKKREMDQMGKQYIKEKGYNVVEMRECEWWSLYKTTTCVKEHLREWVPYKRPLREERLLKQLKSGKLFDYVQCDIKVPGELKKNFTVFPPVFKNTNVGRHGIGLLMKDYAEE